MSIYQQRIELLQQILLTKNIHIYIIEDTISLFYFTGQELSTGLLLISATGSAYLLIDGRYLTSCQTQVYLDVQRFSEEQIMHCLQSLMNHSIQSIGFDSDRVSYEHYLKWQKRLDQFSQAQKYAKALTLVPLQSTVSSLRMIEDSSEIDKMRRAAELGAQGFDFVLNQLTAGTSEKEIARRLEIFWKQHGADGLAFDPIIAFGANSALPHHRCQDSTLKQGDTVLIDIGVVLDKYHSDMTRTVFFGSVSTEMQQVYAIVLEAQQLALTHCHAGMQISELDAIARQYIDQAGYGSFFVHSLGHGIGLEIHELPAISKSKEQDTEMTLLPGMIITIEPGIYLPNIGGVRIEDTVLITDDGYQDMTQRDKSLYILD